MKRCFIVTKESAYYKSLEKYWDKLDIQRKFVCDFLKEKGIESTAYFLGGNGIICDTSSSKDNRHEIRLAIASAKDDIYNFNKPLNKENKHGIHILDRNSQMGKEFAERCVDEKIIINLIKPEVGDYFNEIDYMGYDVEQFICKDILYIRIESDYLKKDDTPEYFTEIKLSEYYKAKKESKTY